MKVAVTIPTGRPNVKRVVRSFLKNAEEHGYNLNDFSVYLSMDTQYLGTRASDFRLPLDLEKSLNCVEYIDERAREGLAARLSIREGIDPLVTENLFKGRGYSKQRNAAVYYATSDGNDVAVCFDDDEAPYVPVKDKNSPLFWTYPDYFSPHLKSLSNGADITRGPCLGYLSPIPSDFEKDIPKDIRRKLGKALEAGSDVINADSFFNLMSKLVYLPTGEVLEPSRPFVVENGPLGKHIYAGNMAINLQSVREGKIPCFYTPPTARGEDTIFALQLEGVKVEEVPSYIFHDAFGMYPGVLEGKLPVSLSPVPVTNKTKDRFAQALTGWLKYAPILIEMTSKSDKEKKVRINQMIENIGDPTRRLAKIFNCPAIGESEKILRTYQDNVLNHLDELKAIQETWKKSIVPTLGVD